MGHTNAVASVHSTTLAPKASTGITTLVHCALSGAQVSPAPMPVTCAQTGTHASLTRSTSVAIKSSGKSFGLITWKLNCALDKSGASMVQLQVIGTMPVSKLRHPSSHVAAGAYIVFAPLYGTSLMQVPYSYGISTCAHTGAHASLAMFATVPVSGTSAASKYVWLVVAALIFEFARLRLCRTEQVS